MMTFTITYYSPRFPDRLGHPFSCSRSLFPELLPGGILILTVPSRVGTSTVVPSAASQGHTGRSMITF